MGGRNYQRAGNKRIDVILPKEQVEHHALATAQSDFYPNSISVGRFIS